MDFSTIIFWVVVAFVGFYLVNIYNRLVALANRYKNSFAQIDVQLKRRYELIPNLVETTKGYLQHEKETLESVIAARNSAASLLNQLKGDPSNQAGLSSLMQAEGVLGSALSKLNVVVEAYPDLKANENMMQLNEELTSTENRISFARQAYNDSVMEYNTFRESFPTNLFANMFSHSQNASLLEFEDKEAIKEVPKVSF